MIGGAYPKKVVGTVVLEVEETTDELLKDEPATEVLLINGRFGGTLIFVGEAVP
jgi:hypothetical protein